MYIKNATDVTWSRLKPPKLSFEKNKMFFRTFTINSSSLIFLDLLIPFFNQLKNSTKTYCQLNGFVLYWSSFGLSHSSLFGLMYLYLPIYNKINKCACLWVFKKLWRKFYELKVLTHYKNIVKEVKIQKDWY